MGFLYLVSSVELVTTRRHDCHNSCCKAWFYRIAGDDMGPAPPGCRETLLMTAAELAFWAAVIVVLYTYLGYPVVIRALGYFFPRPVRVRPITPTITVCDRRS